MVKQLSLFNRPSLNVSRDFKVCLANVVSDSGMSRAEFLDRMNDVAARFGIRLMKGNGSGLTMATFEKWLNVDQGQYMPPIAAIPVICEVGRTMEPLQVIASAMGLEVIDDQGSKKIQWYDAKVAAQEARKTMKQIEAEL